MNIDRHNYEEFFILYWDNELDPSERKAVEEFVQEHADLQAEFRLFGNTRFSPAEEVTFDSKELLARTGSSLVDLSNYEQFLLSHVDDELNSTEKAELEKFLSEHPEIRTELALLSMTRVQPDLHIEFPGKSTLYRKEERRVISLTWFRIAAAAAILLIAGYFTLQSISGGSTQPKTSVPVVINPTTNEKSAIDNSTAKTEPGTESKNVVPPNVPKDDVKKVKDDATVQPNLAKNNDQVTNDQNKNKLPMIANNDLNKTNDAFVQTDPDLIANTEIAGKIPVNVSNKSLDKDDVTIKPTNALNIQTPDKPMDIAKDNGGLKGFLRKATRVLEKRTNIQATTDDNKLLLGAFTVSLK